MNMSEYELIEESMSRPLIIGHGWEMFAHVFPHPLQAIGPALWLVGRWCRMGYCKQKPNKLESIIEKLQN